MLLKLHQERPTSCIGKRRHMLELKSRHRLDIQDRTFGFLQRRRRSNRLDQKQVHLLLLVL